MRRSIPGLLALAAVLCAAAFALAQTPKNAPKPRRVAFLVGVNRYLNNGFKKLDWAVNDVVEMKAELVRHGFDEVVLLTSEEGGELYANKEHIEKQLAQFLKNVHADDVVLVMLSGHGQQLPVKGPDGHSHTDAFFCPADAVMNEPESLVSLSWLTDQKLAAHAGKNVVLVDACRDQVIVDPDKGVNEKGIEGKKVALPEGIAILFSCSSGEKSIERPSLQHGVFAHGVLQVFKAFDPEKDEELTWFDLVNGVMKYVRRQNVAQRPIMAGSMDGLVLTIGRPVPTVKTPDVPRMRRDVVSTQEGTRAGEERDDNALKMKFCWCPPGSFQMGSPPTEPNRENDEGPVDVRLTRGFWLGKYEVTQSEWQSLMGTTIEDQAKKGNDALRGTGSRHPMYDVSHDEAVEFCRKLTERERAAGRLPSGWEYRLPTEAQWEYGCRAGTTTATAFGDTLSSDQANFDGRNPYNGGSKGPYLEKTMEVGSYRPNEWGLFDMHGNVWEWVGDWYADELAGGDDPKGSAQATHRVNRGGGWISIGWSCRSANRSWDSPVYRNFNLGFRVARVSSR